jgi:hypothetical protein
MYINVLVIQACFCCAVGRQGAPRKRMLFCDPSTTTLFWASDDTKSGGMPTLDPSKAIRLSDVLEVRAGTDLDPETSTADLNFAAKAGVQSAISLLQKIEHDLKAGKTIKSPDKKKTLVDSFFGSGKEKNTGLLYATAILRKKAKLDDLPLCISLITEERFVTLFPVWSHYLPTLCLTFILLLRFFLHELVCFSCLLPLLNSSCYHYSLISIAGMF